jgi:hypothetical protein
MPIPPPPESPYYGTCPSCSNHLICTVAYCIQERSIVSYRTVSNGIRFKHTNIGLKMYVTSLLEGHTCNLMTSQTKAKLDQNERHSCSRLLLEKPA